MNKSVVGVIGLLVFIIFASGCINSNNVTPSNISQNTGPYSIGDSTFEMPGGWVKKDSPVTGAVDFWKGKDPNLRIEELDQQKYESNYAEAIAEQKNYNITQETMNISGMEIKVVRATDTRNGDIFYDYFFQKNGKYYQISVWDFTNKAAAKKDIDNAVNTIVTTLKDLGQNSSTSSNSNNTNSNNSQPTNTNNNNGGGDEICPECGGARVVPDGNGNWIACPTCGGDGYV